MKLKYLFKVEFTDGSTIEQTQEDVSQLDPKRNVYYDVLQSGKDVKSFSLRHFFERYGVDLETGIFRVNGVEVVPEPILDKETGKPIVVTKRTLVWYMETHRRFNATYSTKSGALLSTEPTEGFRIYYFGWETEIDGEKHTRVIGIK